MKGDDNSAWEAWRNACLDCEHADPRLGCTVMGVVVYRDGSERGFALVPGGCSRWTARDDTAGEMPEAR